MDQNKQDIKNALEKAEKAFDKAQEDYDQVKAEYDEFKKALTEEWWKNNPNGSKGDLYRYLREEMKDLLAPVESSKRLYQILLDSQRTYQILLEQSQPNLVVNVNTSRQGSSDRVYDRKHGCKYVRRGGIDG
jgi:hypothetical protein